MLQTIEQLGGWSWLILAGLLLLVELTAPGIFFLWLALAAMVIGVITFIVDLPWQADVLLFAALSVLFVLVLRPRFQGKLYSSDDTNLNQRMLSYVGRIYNLSSPITNGRGRLSIDDTLWEISGPDLEAGTKVRIKGIDGTRFIVEQV